MASSKKLSVADQYYIDSHVLEKSIEDLATDVDATSTQINEYLDSKKKKVDVKPATPIAQFATRPGITMMTGAQSEADDKAGPKLSAGSEFHEAHKNQIHKIRPNDPIQ